MATRQVVMKSATKIILLFDFLETVLAQGNYDGALRIAGGQTANEGRIEIYHQSEWGTVCHDYWDMSDGFVACRQLGYSGVEMVGIPSEPGTGIIWLDKVQCSGTEETLAECPFNGWGIHNCDHSDDAGIRCSTEPEGSLRLVNGTTENEGRIEIFHYGEWGTVCDDGWDMVDGEVACRQLGYPGAEMTYYGGEFGLGYGRIWLDDVQCILGTEKTLVDCSHDWNHNCDHSEDAGLKCMLSGSAEEGAVRLRAGLSEMEGRLEIYYEDRWGTVCDDSWDAMDSKVVCKQLGFTGSSGFFRAVDNFHMVELPSAVPIYLDTVECVGDEQMLDYCRHDGWGIHDCSHEEDIAVQCYVKGGGLSGGAVAGIVIGSLVGVFLVCLCCCRSRKKKPPTQQHRAVPVSDVSRAGALALDDVHGGTPDPNNIHPGVDAANLPPPSYNNMKTTPYPPASAACDYPPPSAPYQPPSAPYSQATTPYPPPIAPYPPPTAPIPPPSSSAVPHPYPSGDPGMVPSVPPVYHPANRGYPPTNPGYPPTNPAYPPTNPAHPPTNPAYPPTNPAHPPTNPPYPATNPSHLATNPAYPPTSTHI